MFRLVVTCQAWEQARLACFARVAGHFRQPPPGPVSNFSGVAASLYEYSFTVHMCDCVCRRIVFVWLQLRNQPSMCEVAFSVAGAYLSFFIAQVTWMMLGPPVES